MLKNMAKPAATLSEESSQSETVSAFERRRQLRQKTAFISPDTG